MASSNLNSRIEKLETAATHKEVTVARWITGEPKPANWDIADLRIERIIVRSAHKS